MICLTLPIEIWGKILVNTNSQTVMDISMILFLYINKTYKDTKLLQKDKSYYVKSLCKEYATKIKHLNYYCRI